MFKGVRNVTYYVSDIEKAKEWYQKILNANPVLEIPTIKIFRMEDQYLTIISKADATSDNNNIIAQWIVDDIDGAYKQLLESGATAHTETRSLPGVKIASLFDPFGNILGIAEIVTEADKISVENQPSETAHNVALIRALAAVDERKEIRGNDYLAEIFLREDSKKFIKDKAMREWLLNNVIKGAYESMIARTAYVDNIVKQALNENIPQIVFLGAGYDSRSYRFKDLIKDTIIFELDIHTTQQRKKELLSKANIPVPEQLTYVSINFKTDSIKDVLFNSGYSKDQKTLFIWEGVTMYLTADAIDDTLNFIKKNSKSGSRLFFDYSTDTQILQKIREQNKYSSVSKAEPFIFEIKESNIKSFLSERGYKILEHLNPSDMEERFLKLDDGSSIAKKSSDNVLLYFCFVYAATAA